MVAHIQLGQFEEGRDTANQCISLIEEGAVNWFKYHELLFLLSIRTEEYHEAYSALKKVISHRRFSFLASTIQEVWTIYEAYLQYLWELVLLQLDANFHRAKKK